MLVTATVSMGINGCTRTEDVEVDDAEIEGCASEEEKEAVIEKAVMEWFWGEVELGYDAQ